MYDYDRNWKCNPPNLFGKRRPDRNRNQGAGQPPPEEGEGFDVRIADEEPEEAPAGGRLRDGGRRARWFPVFGGCGDGRVRFFLLLRIRYDGTRENAGDARHLL